MILNAPKYSIFRKQLEKKWQNYVLKNMFESFLENLLKFRAWVFWSKRFKDRKTEYLNKTKKNVWCVFVIVQVETLRCTYALDGNTVDGFKYFVIVLIFQFVSIPLACSLLTFSLLCAAITLCACDVV